MAAALVLWAADARAQCGPLILHDTLSGSTLGQQEEGQFVAGGYTPDPVIPSDPYGSIIYNLSDPIYEGCVEIEITELTEVNVLEYDFLEMFTALDGRFVPNQTSGYFLLYKIFGDETNDSTGKLKLEIGFQGASPEAGRMSDFLNWDPATTYTLRVEFDGVGTADFYLNSTHLRTLDYTTIVTHSITNTGGPIGFLSIRIPNNGSFQADPDLANIVISNLMVYSNSAVVDAFDITPPLVTVPAPVDITWQTSGAVDFVETCEVDMNGDPILCGFLSNDPDGNASVPTDMSLVGHHRIRLRATGPWGSALSDNTVELDVLADADGGVPDGAVSDGSSQPDDAATEPDAGGGDAAQQQDASSDDTGRVESGCNCSTTGSGHAPVVFIVLFLVILACVFFRQPGR